MKIHKVLEKQIQRMLPEGLVNQEHMNEFLNAVSNYYHTYEKEKQLSEHAYEISEKEYQSVLNDLREQNEIQKESIVRIKSLVHLLDNESGAKDENEYDLVSVVNFLEKQIDKTKKLEEALKRARDAAEHSVKAKSNFLSVMSHEIRTPLNAIIGSIHILKQEESLPAQEIYLESLHISAENLLSLINDILDFNKIEEGKVVFASNDINIRNLLNNIKLANYFKAIENENKIKVMFDEEIPLYIKGDETRLSQIMNNLVSNAIKFTKKGNIQIDVQLDAVVDDKIRIYFSVKDSGIGIAPHMQEKIFERFTQENSDITRQFGGSGLGLTIVRRLLQLQNSDIQIESTPGVGSKFFFTLEFNMSSKRQVEEGDTQKEIQNLRGARILLVEDNELNVTIALKLLSNWNAIIEVAQNGQIGLEKFKGNTFDVVLMDLQMPLMDGISATKEIRTFDSKTPIIALTASSSSEIQSNLILSGMNCYVTKPFNPDVLYKEIVKNLEATGFNSDESLRLS